MELIKVGKNTYYIKNPTNIGLYVQDDNKVYIIDSGNDKDSGKKVLRIIEEQGWKVAGIINTHSNADHIGGNKVIQTRTNCPIYTYGIESSLTTNPILEPSFLYGGYPFKDLQSKFLLASPSLITEITNNLPVGLEYISLKGHFFDMIGIKTSDNIIFLADSLFSEETISKYHLFFIYDVKAYLETLDYLNTLSCSLYIPSHCEATTNIEELININRQKINEIISNILLFCKNPVSFESILKYIFDTYELTMNPNQYVLIGSTVRSYLSYLYNENLLTYTFKDNIMYWESVK